MNGFIHLKSNGSNDLNETNVLKSRIINDIYYEGYDYITNLGLKNKFKLDFKKCKYCWKKSYHHINQAPNQIQLHCLI